MDNSHTLFENHWARNWNFLAPSTNQAQYTLLKLFLQAELYAPQIHNVEALTPDTSECDCIWEKGL